MEAIAIRMEAVCVRAFGLIGVMNEVSNRGRGVMNGAVCGFEDSK